METKTSWIRPVTDLNQREVLHIQSMMKNMLRAQNQYTKRMIRILIDILPLTKARVSWLKTGENPLWFPSWYRYDVSSW